MDRNRRAIGLGLAIAVLTALMIAIPASLAGAVDSPSPSLSPPNGQIAVKPGDEVVFGGTADEGATLVRSFLRVRAADGSEVQDDIDSTDGTSIAEGSISGSWILPFLEADADTIELHVVVDSGGTELTGVSEPVEVDQVRPSIRGAELISTDQVRIRFTEPVDTPSGRDQALDWQVDGVPPVSVDGSGAARVLNLGAPQDRDATPEVDYLPRAPISQSYRDKAHNNVNGDKRPTIARDLTPPVPPDIDQVAGKAPSDGTVVANDPTPDVRLSGIKEGDVGQVYLETNDEAGFQRPGDTLLGGAGADSSGTVTITTPDLGSDGDHVLYGVAHDRAKCQPGGSEECPNHSTGTEVTYRLDTIAPRPMFAVTHGTEEGAVDVRFTEPVAPDDGTAGDWLVSAGGPISAVEGTGDQRTLDADSPVPSAATLSYTASGTQYSDAAGNQLPAFSGMRLLNGIPPVLEVTDPNGDIHVNAGAVTIRGTAEETEVVKAYDDANGNGELDAGEPQVGPPANVSSLDAGTPFEVTVPLQQDAENHFVVQGERTEASQTFIGPAEDVPTIVEDSTAPTIALQAPVGGEVLRGEQDFTIQWDAGDDRALAGSPIRIDYSANGGGSWTMVADRIADTGEYEWTTPDQSTDQGRIRVFATDGAGNRSGPSASGDFLIDALEPFFVARTVDAHTIRVRFSEPVSGLVSNLEWYVDDTQTSAVDPPTGIHSNVEELILTTSQEIGSRDTPTIEYRPLPVTTTAGQELVDRAGNPILPKTVVAGSGIAVPPVLEVTDPDTEVHVNADTSAIRGTAEQTAVVKAYRDTDADGELDQSEKDAGPVGSTTVPGRAAGTPFEVSVPLEQDAENHFVLQGERTEGSQTVAGPTEDVPTIVEDSTAPTITLQAPAGGEVLRGNQDFTIEWDADDDRALAANPITIEYSANGGGTWTTVADRIGDSGEYEWTTPDASTEQARIRVFATDGAGNRGGPAASGDFIIDAVVPFFSARTVDANTIVVQFSEPVSGFVSSLEWYVDDTQAADTDPSTGIHSNVEELTLTTSQRIGSRETPTIEYRPLPTSTASDNELVDRAGNPILPKTVVAGSGIEVPPVLDVTEPDAETTVNADTSAIRGTAEQTAVVKAYRDTDADGELDQSEKDAGPVGSTTLGSRAAGTPFEVSVPLEQDAENHFVLQGERTEGSQTVAGPAEDVPTIVEDSTAPTITLQAPAGGEVLRGNQDFTIEWDADDDRALAANPITIEYSANGGGTWTTVADRIGDSGEYEWTTPDASTEQARIRVFATDGAGNRGGPAASGDFIIDAVVPFFSARTVDANSIVVEFSEPVSGLVSNLEWYVDDTQASAVDPATGMRSGIEEITLTTSQRMGSNDTPTVEYRPLPTTSAAGQELVDRAGNPILPKTVVAASGIAVRPVLEVTDPEAETTVNADTAAIRGTAEQTAVVKAYRDADGDGELDESEKDAGAVGSSTVSSRAAGTPFSVTVPLEQNAENHFVLQGERTESSNTVAGPAEAVPTIVEDSTAPTITLQAPQGGEVLRGNQDFTIEWDAGDDRALADNPITIEYSANGGGTWTTIADRIGDSGEYEWTTPDASTEQARIRVFAIDGAGNGSGPDASGDFIIDALAPSFSARTVDPNTIRVRFSEPVSGFVSSLEWYIDDTRAADTDPSIGLHSNVEELTLTTSQRMGSRDTPTVEYRPLLAATVTGNELLDRAGNPILSKTVVAASGIVVPPVLEVTDPDDEAHVNADTATIRGTAEQASVVKAYRDTDADGELDDDEKDAGPVRSSTVSSRAAGTPFSVSVPLEQNAENHFVLQGERTEGSQTVAGPAEDVPTIVEDSTAPTITLEAPAGGEILRGSQDFTIEWDADDDRALAANPITIEYSANGGASWATIADGAANSGEYDWTTPDASTEQARIRVFAIDGAGNRGGPDASGDFIVDALAPSFTARTVDATTIVVRFSEPVSGFVSSFEWYVDGTEASAIDPPPGMHSNIEELTLTTSQRMGSGDTPTVEYRPLLAATVTGNELLDRAGNPILPKTVVAASGIVVPPVLEVTDPDDEAHVNADTAAIRGTAEQASVVKAYRDTDADGELDQSEKDAGAVGSTSVSSRAAGTPFSVTVPLEQNAENHFVLQGERTEGSETVAGPAEDVPTIVEDSTAPTITLQAPAGGEVLRGSQDFTIEWDADDDRALAASPIRIEYSANGGGWWTTIADEVADTGEYEWTTPDQSTEQARIRVFATDGAGNRGGPAASGTFIIDAVEPSFTARTVDPTTIEVEFSEPVSGFVANLEWDVDGSPARATDPAPGIHSDVEDLTLTTSQRMGSRATPTVEYGPLATSTTADQELTDRAGNPILRKTVVAASGIAVQPALEVTDPEAETTVNADSTEVEGTAEEASVVKAYRDADADGELDQSEKDAGPVGSTTVGSRTAGTPFSIGVPLEQNAENHFVLQAERTEGSNTVTGPAEAVPTIIEDSVAPTITLEQPEGGEIFRGNQDFTIEWDADDDHALAEGPIRIEYSANGGGTWTTIADRVADSGEYEWTTPDNSTEQGRIRVFATDRAGNRGGPDASGEFIVDALAPSFAARTVDSSTILVEFSEPVSGFVSSLEWRVDGTEANAVDRSMGLHSNVEELTLTPSQPIGTRDTPTIEYRPLLAATVTGNELLDRAGNPILSKTVVATDGILCDYVWPQDSVNGLIVGTDLADTFCTENGSVTVHAKGGDDVVLSTAGHKVVLGGPGNDRIQAASGNDILVGGDGDDQIDAGTGNDVVFGGTGVDTIFGGDGDDRIDAGDGNDGIDGGTGNDHIVAGPGFDHVIGGDGNDRLNGGDGNDHLDAGTGNDTVFGGNGLDAIFGGDGNDKLRGFKHKDLIRGGKGRDLLNGDGGRDRLVGQGGRDRLRGGKGRDLLNGGPAKDKCNGGGGRDRVRRCERGKR